MTKPTKWPVRPAKTQIGLGIRPGWSESSLSVWRNTGSSVTHWAHSKDSDQTGRMPRLIWVFFAERTCHFVGFIMLWLICSYSTKLQWASPCIKGSYRIGEQRRLRPAFASEQSHQNIRCSLTQWTELEEASDRATERLSMRTWRISLCITLKSLFSRDCSLILMNRDYYTEQL